MTSLSNKIKKQKLPISFSLIILMFISFGVFTINGLNSLGDLTTRIYEHPLVVSNASLHAALNITKMHRSMKDVVLANSADEIEQTLNRVAINEQKVYEHLDIIRDGILGEEGRALEKQTRQLFENWKPIRTNVVSLLNSGNRQEAILITKTNGADHVANLEAKMLELTSYARNKADSLIKLAETKQSNIVTITIFLTIVGVLLSLIIAFIATKLVLNAEKLLRGNNDRLQKAFSEIQQLRQAMDQVPVYVFMKDSQLRYVYANRLTLELFGCSADELLGLDDTQFFPPETAKRLREVDLRVLAGERTSEEIDVSDDGANRRVYWEVKAPIYAEPERNSVSGLLGISTDITDRKQAGEEQDKLVAELQKALSEVRTLRGFLPVCSHCKNIRDDKGYWGQIESYIHEHSDAEISHGICPDCAKEHYPGFDLYGDEPTK